MDKCHADVDVMMMDDDTLEYLDHARHLSTQFNRTVGYSYLLRHLLFSVLAITLCLDQQALQAPEVPM